MIFSFAVTSTYFPFYLPPTHIYTHHDRTILINLERVAILQNLLKPAWNVPACNSCEEPVKVHVDQSLWPVNFLQVCYGIPCPALLLEGQ